MRSKASFAVLNGIPSVKTALRVRPCSEAFRRNRLAPVPVRGQAGSYVYDLVLSDTASQHQAYQHVAAPLVDSFIQGESAVLLLYGASQTGKTHTLQGSGSSQEAGVIQQAVQAIFRGLSIVPKSKYQLSASYCGLSVGNDAQLLDLLAAPNAAAAAAALRDGSAAAALAGLTSWSLEDAADIAEVLRCRRLQASAAVPARAAKGGMHTMLTLQLDSFDADRTLIHSKHLSFVELAAPDPKDPLGIGRSNENAYARSLAMAYNSLGKVLAALRNSAPATAAAAGPAVPSAAAALAAGGLGANGQQLQHVPWRDSPLTRWLQERLHSASAITLLGTVSASAEAAADSLATISWVSRFSSASRSGAGGVVVSFAWDVVADPEAAAGSYLRFHPEHEVIQNLRSNSPKPAGARKQQQQQGKGSPLRPVSPTPGSLYEPGCSSPMVNQCSPNLAGSEGVKTPASVRLRSASSVCAAGRHARWQQQLQASPDSTPVMRHVQQWQQQQEQLMQQYQQQGAGAAVSAELAAAGSPTAAGAGMVLHDTAAEQQQQQQNAAGDALRDEVLLYGELFTALRRAGGGLRAEAILEQLLQELGAARAGLSAEQGEAKTLRRTLAALQEEHSTCEATKRVLQEQLQEAQHQLGEAQKSLSEVSADRDLFLRRLQQLEVEADEEANAGRPASRLEMQRQKAHAAQLRMMESELNALAASNQQLRSQLDLTSQALTKASRDKLAVQESAGEVTDRLQQELEVLRSDADIEGAIRKELEASVAQLRSACEVSAKELAALTADKAVLQQQYMQEQQSVDALAAELQDTTAKASAAEQQAVGLIQKLADVQQEHGMAQQQLSALQAQVSALEEMTQQLQQQQQQAMNGAGMHEEHANMLQGLVADVQHVFSDFALDVEAALPQQWRQLIEDPAATAATAAGTISSTATSHAEACVHNSKLRSRLLTLLGSSKRSVGSKAGSTSVSGITMRPGGSMFDNTAFACDGNTVTLDPQQEEAPGINAALPAVWAHKLEAVVGVLRLAADERSRVHDELQGSRKRMQLLESNVEELRKLVATQEDLQQQLATQLSACQNKADAAAEAHKVQQGQLQQQLEEAQQSVDALADELQECQASLKDAQQGVSDRDQALDALADELVDVAAARDAVEASKQQVEEQVMALAAELEEALLQLSIRDQVLDQVWGQLKGLPQYTAAATAGGADAGMLGKAGAADELSGALDGTDSWQIASCAAPFRSATLEKLLQQQQQGPQHSLRQRQRQSALASAGSAGAPSAAASLAQQAVQAARRRSSQSDQQQSAGGDPSSRDRASCGDQDSSSNQGTLPTGMSYFTGTGRLLNGCSTTGTPPAGKQQQQQQGLHRHSRQSQSAQQQQQQQVQPLVVAAVKRLRSQVVSLQQQLAEAVTGSREGEVKLRQQWDELDVLQKDKLLLQSKTRKLTAQLQEKEAELEQAQEHCKQLLSSLKQVQQRLQQQQGTSRTSDPSAPTTPSLAQQNQTELQLVDTRRQLAEAQQSLAETSAQLSAERAARLAAEDAEAGRQQLLQRLAGMQADLSELHGQLVAEKKEAVRLREELTLCMTSRDTWRDAAKRSEAAASEAQGAAEVKSTELTRARAELLQARQQVTAITRQMDQHQLQALLNKGAEMGCADSVSEGLAARLAAAQVMRREAEDKAAELTRKLAAAERSLLGLQHQQGEAEADLEGQLSLQEARLARTKAEMAAQRAAAEGGAVQLADMAAQLQEQGRVLAAVRAERDALQQQLAALQDTVRQQQTPATGLPQLLARQDQQQQQQQHHGLHTASQETAAASAANAVAAAAGTSRSRRTPSPQPKEQQQQQQLVNTAGTQHQSTGLVDVLGDIRHVATYESLMAMAGGSISSNGSSGSRPGAAASRGSNSGLDKSVVTAAASGSGTTSCSRASSPVGQLPSSPGRSSFLGSLLGGGWRNKTQEEVSFGGAGGFGALDTPPDVSPVSPAAGVARRFTLSSAGGGGAAAAAPQTLSYKAGALSITPEGSNAAALQLAGMLGGGTSVGVVKSGSRLLAEDAEAPCLY